MAEIGHWSTNLRPGDLQWPLSGAHSPYSRTFRSSLAAQAVMTDLYAVGHEAVAYRVRSNLRGSARCGCGNVSSSTWRSRILAEPNLSHR